MHGRETKTNQTISVVIVNWNGRRWLESCLPSLAQQTYQDVETIVVDNGSTDDSVSWLAAEWPHVQVLPQKRNLGFARANNLGIRASSGAYIVTLNNDTRLPATCLAELAAAISGPTVGMVAARILQWQKPDHLDSAGIEVDRAGIAWQRGWNQEAAQAQLSDDTFGPSAAAALYRRAMLDEVGLFDEDFFAYYEDVDLAWRAQQAGWRCRYAPQANVYHWHSATAAAIPARKLYLISRNKIWTLIKNYPTPDLWRWLPLILFYDMLGAAYQLSQTQRKAALRGRLDAIRRRRIPLAKRPSPVRSVPLSSLTPPWRLLGRIRVTD